MVGKILLRHATPMEILDTLDNKTLDEDCDSTGSESDCETDHLGGFPNSAPEVSSMSIPDLDRDRVHQNTHLLSRDLLYMAELVRAISDGDIGRIEDMLPLLAMMFQGASGNNNCTEILHFILNLKHVWTPEFA
jgi:hypothetical protein